MAMYIIDSNILVVEILAKYNIDENARKILSFYKKIPLMKRIITDFIVAEFELTVIHSLPLHIQLGNLEKNRLHDTTISYMRQILTNYTLVYPNQQVVNNAFMLYQQSKSDNISKYITYSDCLLLSMAIQFQYTLITLDTSLLDFAKELNVPYFKVDIQ